LQFDWSREKSLVNSAPYNKRQDFCKKAKADVLFIFLTMACLLKQIQLSASILAARLLKLTAPCVD